MNYPLPYPLSIFHNTLSTIYYLPSIIQHSLSHLPLHSFLTTSFIFSPLPISTIYYPLSTIHYLLISSIIHYELPTTHYLLSTINYPSSIIFYDTLFAIHYLLSTIHYPAFTIPSPPPLFSHYFLHLFPSTNIHYLLSIIHYPLPTDIFHNTL